MAFFAPTKCHRQQIAIRLLFVAGSSRKRMARLSIHFGAATGDSDQPQGALFSPDRNMPPRIPSPAIMNRAAPRLLRDLATPNGFAICKD